MGYERSLAEIVGTDEARRWLERGLARQAPRPIAGGSHLEDLRRTRLEQLRAMTDEQFAAEVREHQAARWRASSLLEHAKAHAQDFTEIMGHPLTPTELEELSRAALSSWDRLFTELERRGVISYIFFSRLEQSVVVYLSWQHGEALCGLLSPFAGSISGFSGMVPRSR